MIAIHDPGVSMFVILATVALVVVFWRTVIKLVLIAVVVLVISGLLDALRVLH
jgi:hypothetical protein